MSAGQGHPPVIVIGMHRSGTAMVVKALEALGVFMGARKEANEEALFFVRCNEWLLARSGAAWDTPAPARRLAADRQARAQAAAFLAFLARTPRAISFLGLRGYLRLRDIARIDRPWGWKDPRTTFTLPIWLDVFVGARVLHVCRHGVDVAQSLRAREGETRRASRREFATRGWAAWLRPWRVSLWGSVHCATLADAFALWEEYMAEARTQLAALEGRALEIRYEDAVADPSGAVQAIAGFVGLDADAATLSRAAGMIRPGRAFAHRTDPPLASFADEHAQRLTAFGYRTDYAASRPAWNPAQRMNS